MKRRIVIAMISCAAAFSLFTTQPVMAEKATETAAETSSETSAKTDKKSKESAEKEEKAKEQAAEEVSKAAEEQADIGTHTMDNPYTDLTQDDINNSLVTFLVTVPDGFSDSVAAYLYNTENQNYYMISTDKDSGYQGQMYMPAGSYEIHGLSIGSDTAQSGNYGFSIETGENFDVTEGDTYNIVASIVSAAEEVEDVPSFEPDTADTKSAETEVTENTDTGDTIPEAADTAITSEDASAVESDTQNTDETVLPWRRFDASKANDNDLVLSGLSNDGYDIVVSITHSGMPGEAKYTVSVNGIVSDESVVPATPSGSETSSAAILDKDGKETGLTVSFRNMEYHIGASYSISTKKEWNAAKTGTGDGEVMMSGIPPANVRLSMIFKIVEGGTMGEATYVVSDDNGETWTEEAITPDDGIINIDGITIQMSDGNFESGDLFTAEVQGQERKDYSSYVMMIAFGAVAAVLIGICANLAKKKPGKDRYRLIRK